MTPIPDGQAVTFYQFMTDALYHPERGYYSQHVREVGRGGDFSTSVTLDPAFARTLSHWAWNAAPEVDRKKHFVEIGAGNGQLAEGILKNLGMRQRWKMRYHIVEISPKLQALQKKRLHRWGRKIQWHDSLESALDACRGQAAIFSNEVPDAMPVQIYIKSQGNWRELCLQKTSKGWEERLGSSPQKTSSALERIATYPENQRVEICTYWSEWAKAWAPHWKAGKMLTIDYGEPIETLYHRRPHGTLRAYFHHQRLQGKECYERAGRQDLTVDVNFTDLMQWGKELGLKTESLQTQREFLLAQDPALEAEAKKRASLSFLLDPHGAGGCFMALVQSPQK